MIVISEKHAQEGLAARLRKCADELDAAGRQERAQAAALNTVMSQAYGAFLAGRFRAHCELDFRAAVQHHKDSLGFQGRFEKGSDEWNEMLVATDPVYRRLEIARQLEKHAKSLVLKAWVDADVKADESDFWGMAERMPIDAKEFLLDYYERNLRIASDICDEGLEDEEALSLRRADANVQAAFELMVESGSRA